MSNTALRKKQFKAALVYAGTTQSAWAAERKISVTHLSEVLNQKRTSRWLNADIDALIAKYAPRRKAVA